MTVFVVTSSPKFADTEVEGVFSTMELAQAYVAKWHPTYNMDITAHQVDNQAPARRRSDE